MLDRTVSKKNKDSFTDLYRINFFGIKITSTPDN